MQQVTLKNTRVLFAAALPMNNHIVNKTRVLIGAKVAPQFEKMIQKEYEQMQRMWYMQGCRRCALLVLGEAGEIATTTAIIIPK